MTLRTITPPASPRVTVVYIQTLMQPDDLERLVFAPLAAGHLDAPPETLVRSGRFAAPALSVANDPATLRDGLLAAQAAIHLDGQPGAIMLGSGKRTFIKPSFGANLEENVAVIVQNLAEPDIRLERLGSADRGGPVIIYLANKARPELVEELRAWKGSSAAPPQPLSWSQAAGELHRLPPTLEAPVPDAAIAALRKGYIAVLSDDLPYPLLAPTTLELLFSGPRDLALPAAVRRMVIWPRLLAAFLGLTLGAFLIAVAGYHHALVPGPFLAALAASRANLPFPVVLEMFLVSFIGDAAEAAASRLWGPRATVVAWIGITLAFTAAMQVGVIGPISGMAGIFAVIVRDILPHTALSRTLRTWRYLFMVAAAGLGIYGMALLGFLLLVYVSEERAFTHPIRMQPGEGAPL
ncbi:MAG TPA: spore germination protein [Symbiobacteriaceae bacterium]|nr:spore germination protein [Symbiobacteriaceae bacterium]